MNIQSLSNLEIEQNLMKLVLQERALLHEILLHIKEVDQRRIYLEKGKTSLFEYLVTDLGYSNAAAQRRIEGARLIREIPEVADRIKDGSLHLGHIGEIVRAVKQKELQSPRKVSTIQKRCLLESIECKTIHQTQHILSAELDIQLKTPESKKVQKDESVHLQITLSKEQYARLLECQNRASHKLLAQRSIALAEVIDHLSDFYLKQAYGKLPKSTSESEVKKRVLNKNLTPKTKREVKALYRMCQHTDSGSQEKCGSTFLLEVDHKVPRWAGGTHEKSNLTVLCSAHNKAKYRREAGMT